MAEVRGYVALGIKAAARDGIGEPERVRALRAVFDEAFAAYMSEVGHADVREVPVSASSDARDESVIETREVASMTGLSERQARRLISDLGGRQRPSKTWQIERELVDAYLTEREARRA